MHTTSRARRLLIVTFRIFKIGEPMQVCLRCGSVVAQLEVQKHINWHNEVENNE